MSESRNELLVRHKAWSPKMMSPLALLLGALFCNSSAYGLLPFPLQAGQRGSVACLESPSISYDVYLPSTYTTNGTALPILYTLNPSGGGMVSDFQTVCASLNIITIGVIGSANGAAWDTVMRQFYAVSRDLRQRVLFDPTAEFAAGLSGGGENSYIFSRFRAQHVAGVLAMGGWLARYSVSAYTTTDRVQTNLLVARTTGTTDTGGLYYLVADSNYLASCGAVIKDWSFSGGHSSAPDSVKTACLTWLLSQRRAAGVNDRSNSVGQAADWRARITAGQSGTVLRECVTALMSQPRSWNALQAQLVVDDLMTNYNSFRALAVDHLAQGDFASDLFYYLARGAGNASDSRRYLGSLKALTGIDGINGDRAGDIYSLLVQYGYPAPVAQTSVLPIPGTLGQMSVWLREDTPGLSYTPQYRSGIATGTWQDLSISSPATNTIWSVGIDLPPYPGWRFYRVGTVPVPATSPTWPPS